MEPELQTIPTSETRSDAVLEAAAEAKKAKERAAVMMKFESQLGQNSRRILEELQKLIN